MKHPGFGAHTLGALARFSTRYPRTVLVLAVLLAASAAGLAATRMTVRTSNLDLISSELAPVRQFHEFAAAFGTPNTLVIVLESDDPQALRRAADHLTPTLRQVPRVRSVFDKLPLAPGVGEVISLDPYLTSHDGGMLFLFVQPDDPHSRAETIAPFVTAVEAAVNHLLAGSSVTAGLTGMPRFALDDRDIIQHDLARLSVLSLALVLILFATGFGALWRPLLAVVALLIGVAVTLGLASLYPAHLTLLSAFFASILFGLGVDAGIHIVDRTEELLGLGVAARDAPPQAVADLAPGLVGSALSTASLLGAMQFSGFRGFEELGTITSTGILVCLLAMTTVLPALLTWSERRPVTRRSIARRSATLPRPSHRRLGTALVKLQSRPLAWLLTLAAAGGLVAGFPPFDSDYLNLQPADSETVRLEREMVRRSDWSPEFAAFTAESRNDLEELAWNLADDEAVGTVRSLLDFEVMPGILPELPPDLLRAFRTPEGRYAVYAYPQANIWDPVEQETFVDHMLAMDRPVTGMPILGRFMVERSRRALVVSCLLGVPLLLLWVFLTFRELRWTLLAITPTVLTMGALAGLMHLFGLALNPLDIMALPIVLGIAVDDGIHIVHRFLAENGDAGSTLIGTGRSVVLTSATNLAAFGTLTLSSHQGLASFAWVLCLGVGSALVFSVGVLPGLMRWAYVRLQANSA